MCGWKRANLKRLRDELGILCSRSEVQITHRCLDVGVPHPFLDSPDVRDSDHPRAERVAQVMEAQLAQASTTDGCLKSSAERGSWPD